MCIYIYICIYVNLTKTNLVSTARTVLSVGFAMNITTCDSK